MNVKATTLCEEKIWLLGNVHKGKRLELEANFYVEEILCCDLFKHKHIRGLGETGWFRF